jgi:C-terminal processing protease CtpA/Prc
LRWQCDNLQDGAAENLTAAARLLGYLRYFHPADGVAGADWHDLAVQLAGAARAANGPAALCLDWLGVLEPIAPTMLIFPTGQEPRPSPIEDQKATKPLGLVRWHHRGLGGPGPYWAFFVSERLIEWVDGGKAQIPADEIVTLELGAGITCRLPLAVLVNADGTLPARDLPKPRCLDQELAIESPAVRLAIVSLAWSALRHFFPYFDEIALDWDAVLPVALRQAAAAETEPDMFDSLRWLTAKLCDGHARAYHPAHDETQLYVPPFSWAWVEQSLVVQNLIDVPSSEDAAKHSFPEPGDVIVAIDGRPTEEVLAEHCKLASASTAEAVTHRGLETIFAGGKDERMALTLNRRHGKTVDINVARSLRLWEGNFQSPLNDARPAKIAELEPGVHYVDLTRITEAEFQAALPQLQTARAIVLDIRGYPPPARVPIELLGHFTDQPICSAPSLTPIVTRPDRRPRYMSWLRLTVQARPPRLRAKLAILTDERAISYAEGFVGLLAGLQATQIFGSRTGGCMGVPIFYGLPGGYTISWTGMRALQKDGSRYHGVGIAPTVPVTRTIAAVAEGRDEVLERAIDALRE